MSHVRWVVLLAVLGAFVGCGVIPPLPEGSLDPIEPLNPSREKTEKAPGPSKEIPPQTATTSPTESSKTTGTEIWVGRYRDSRGKGEITFSLVRSETTIHGTWKLRTGGRGPFTAIVGADGITLSFHMENAAPECPGLFEGQATLEKNVLRGKYKGEDCQGQVSDGHLDLELK